MRRPYQIRILDLLLLTAVVALVIQFWPRNSGGMREILPLIGWTALCILQLVLFRKAWLSAPNERDKDRYVAYLIAYPACLVPILVWLFFMVALALDTMGAHVNTGDAMVPILLLFGAWGCSIIAIPASFFTSRHQFSDKSFLWLRIIAMINLAGPAIPAST